MRKEMRAKLRRQLDEMQSLYRRLGKEMRSHKPWLREVRQALGVSAAVLSGVWKRLAESSAEQEKV